MSEDIYIENIEAKLPKNFSKLAKALTSNVRRRKGIRNKNLRPKTSFQ